MGSCISCISKSAASGKHGKNKVTRVSASAASQHYIAVGSNGYTAKGVLGQNDQATFRLLENKTTKELVAAKCIPRDAYDKGDLEQGDGQFKAIEREIILHKSLIHPNIIRLREVFSTEKELVIVQAYASGGSLEEKLRLAGPLDEFTARKLFRQVVEGVEYCHKKRLYHRHLQTSNILLHGSVFEAKVKLSDFSHARSAFRGAFNDELKYVDPLQSPPERFGPSRQEAHARDDSALDVWLLGLVLYRMLTVSHPFLDPNNPSCISSEVMERVSAGNYLPLDDGTLTPACLDLVDRMFQADPQDRIRVTNILTHPWLTGVTLPDTPGSQLGDLQPAHQTESNIAAIVARAHLRQKKMPTDQARTKRKSRSSSIKPYNILN